MKKIVLTATCFLLSFVLIAAVHEAGAKTVLKYGHIAPESSPHGIASKSFAEYIQSRTNGELQIDVFPAGQLGGERTVAEQCQNGTLDMTDVTTAVLSNMVPQVSLYDLPFLWPSRSMAYAIFNDEEFNKIFFDAFQPKGMYAFAYNENELRDFANNKREVKNLADMKGLKVRVMESSIYLDTFKALGANPVPMPFPELYSALQQGTIDAQENPILNSWLNKLLEVTPFVTLLQHSLCESIAVVNLDRWNQLSKEHQALFIEAGKRMTSMVHSLNTQHTAAIIAKLEKEGKPKITRLTPEARAEFVKAVQPIHEQWAQKVGNIPNKPEYGRYAGVSYYQMIQQKIKEYQ